MSSFLFCLLMFSSLHACNGRPLDLSADDKQILLSGKDARSSLTAQKIKSQERIWAKIDEGSVYESRRNSRAPEIKERDIKGTMLQETSFRALEETSVEKWKRQTAWPTLQSVPNDETTDEEVDHFNDNEIPEDVVVMDYAQPQRKPPIHN